MIHPIIVDSRPAYLRGERDASSLLLLPLGLGTLLGHVRERIAEVCDAPPSILTTFPRTTDYEQGILAVGDGVDAVFDQGEFAARVQDYEPSDRLLLIDPGCFPKGGLELRRLLEPGRSSAAQAARHHIALDTTHLGTKERVHIGEDGRIRRIQRYYDQVTWPFAAAVPSSLVPASSLLVLDEVRFASLAELRRRLAGQGVASEDVFLSRAAFDLTEEHGYLFLCEGFTRAAARRRPNGHAHVCGGLGAESSVHPTVRTEGPVVIQEGVVVEEGVTLVGPTVLGRGCRVRQGAVVAQSVIVGHSEVPRRTRVCQRVLFGQPAEETSGAYRDFTALRRVDPCVIANQLDDEEPPAPRYAWGKAALDGLMAGGALLLLAPLLAVCAVLVKLTSRGPIFYGAEREGVGGRRFKCWKFRTMVANAEALQRRLAEQSEVDGPQFKIDRDPRVTSVGRLFRATNLDELPQLWNVVRGEMSLIGPRPSPFRENQLCVPWRRARLSVRPGITGLWQLCRHDRSYGDFHQWIEYDLLYVRHMSPLLDLKIFVATVLTLGGRFSIPVSWLIPPQSLDEEACLQP